MQGITFRTISSPDYQQLQGLMHQGVEHTHIHAIDMPFRLTSTWQDRGCNVGVWEKSGELIAWAVFLPAWWNVDYAIHASLVGTDLEREIFTWGKEEMKRYNQRTGHEFWGSFEFYGDRPQADQTRKQLEAAGYKPMSWTTDRLTLDLTQALPPIPECAGFHVRPLNSTAEIGRYVELQQAAFESSNMTQPWRERTLAHPHYQPEIDLVVADQSDTAVGFCICWTWQNEAQLEPLGIHPDYQGQGLGKFLEVTAAHLLKAKGLKTLHVDHPSFNESAIALSRQTGFQPFKQALRYYVPI